MGAVFGESPKLVSSQASKRMRDSITNFFLFRIQNVIEPVYWAMLLAWLGLLAVSLHSIWSRQALGMYGKLAWSVALVALPLVGLYLYLFYSLAVADYSAFERFGFFKRKDKA